LRFIACTSWLRYQDDLKWYLLSIPHGMQAEKGMRYRSSRNMIVKHESPQSKTFW
jgi:hypothetical protein